MGDANKIKKIVSDSSKEYLSKSLESIESGRQYNLADEFAATKKNRSLFVVGIAALTVAGFALTAYLMTKAIERSTESQTVDVSSFEDLNLKDLLDVAKRTEEQFAGLNREAGDLERAMDAEILAASRAYDADAELLAVERISEGARRTRIAAAQRKRDAAIAAIRERYDPLIAAKKAELDDAAKALETYDSRMLEQAKKNEELIASERRLFELERAELTAYYEGRIEALSRDAEEERARLAASKDALVAALEKAKADELAEAFLRYNPVFEERDVLATIESFSEERARPSPLVPQSIIDSGVDAALRAADIREALDAIDAVSARLGLVPYDNSIPAALGALRRSALSLASSYAAIVEACAALVVSEAERSGRLETELSQARAALAASRLEASAYRGAVESLARGAGDAGYVLASADGQLYLWLGQLALGAAEAWVFRDDMAIARISVKRDGNLYKGAVLELAGEETPRPFDKILVALAPGASPASGGNQ